MMMIDLRILLQNKYKRYIKFILVPPVALVETVLVVLAAGDVTLAALAQDLRQLARAGQVLEARAAARHELAADEDGGHHAAARHRLHDVHHHLTLPPLLVDLHALKLGAQVIQSFLGDCAI